MGSVLRQQYYVTLPDGTREKRESSKWYVQWKLADGSWVRKPAYTDRKASEKMLQRMERETAQRAEGIIDELTEAAGRPLKAHRKDFIRHLRDDGCVPLYCKSTSTRIQRICRFGRVKTIGQLTKSRVARAISKLRNPATWPKPFSVSTANGYRTAIKAFSAWLKSENRIAVDRLLGVQKEVIEPSQRTKIRRPLNPKEFGQLLDATISGKPWEGIPGRDRVALYILAAFTGFRRRELSSVSPKSFAFGESPSLTVARGYSKRRRTDTVPLKREVAELFRGYVQGKPSDVPLWKIGRMNTAKMIQADLDAAGIEWRKGKIVVEFHSMRQNFATGLARAGVHPKLAQKLVRHSDINLTMGTYTVLEDDDERAAVESMGVPANLAQALTQKVRRNETESKSIATVDSRGGKQKKVSRPGKQNPVKTKARKKSPAKRGVRKK